MANETTASREIVIFTDKQSLSLDAAYRLLAIRSLCAAQRRPFRIALAGGSTPELLYRLLVSLVGQESGIWTSDFHVFFGDERCVAVDAPESNFRMAREALLAHVNIPAINIHRMPADLADREAAAQQYEAELRDSFQTAAGELPRFDLVLLGMGPDGHCASLFPHKSALKETDRLVVASEPGMDPPVPRLTVTLPVLNNAANLLFLVAGEDKANRVVQVLEGPPDPDSLPSQSVQPVNGKVSWLLDRAAAGKLAL